MQPEGMEHVTTERPHVRMRDIVLGGSMAEGVASISALILAVIGVAGVLPFTLIPISAIILGASLILGGGALTARFSRLVAEGGARHTGETLGGGLAMASLAGIAGLILGILGLAGIDTLTMLPVAAIIFGGALLLTSGSSARLSAVYQRVRPERPMAQGVATEAIAAASGTEVLVGLGSIVLGILGTVGIDPVILSGVSYIALGAALLLGSSAIIARFMSIFVR